MTATTRGDWCTGTGVHLWGPSSSPGSSPYFLPPPTPCSLIRPTTMKARWRFVNTVIHCKQCYTISFEHKKFIMYRKSTVIANQFYEIYWYCQVFCLWNEYIFSALSLIEKKPVWFISIISHCGHGLLCNRQQSWIWSAGSSPCKIKMARS